MPPATDGDLRFGRLTAFQNYQMQIVMGIGQLAMSAMQLAQAMGGATKILELLDRQPQLPISGGDVPDEPMRGAISFDKVVFSYPTSPDVDVLRTPPGLAPCLRSSSALCRSTRLISRANSV